MKKEIQQGNKKRPEPKQLVCVCKNNASIPITNTNGSEVGRLFNGCKINIISEDMYNCYTNFYISERQDVSWEKLQQEDNKTIGTINQSGGVIGESMFKNLMKKCSWEFTQFEPNHKGSDFIIKINGTNYLAQLKTNLQEGYKLVTLSKTNKDNIIKEAKERKMIPLLINYHPHDNRVHIINLETDEVVFNENIVIPCIQFC